MSESVLDVYQRRQKELEHSIKQAGATVSGMWMFQELLYRIDVLQALQMFSAVAPVGNNLKAMLTHYQMLDGYINTLVYDRQYGIQPNKDLVMHREAAHMNLCRVIEDYRKRFSSFTPGEPGQYKREIEKSIITVLPAWIQYREVYVSIKQKEEAA